jgi:hypothetical protein
MVEDLQDVIRTFERSLRDAVDYELIGRNPADRVRVASVRLHGSRLDTAAQISALLDVARSDWIDRHRRSVDHPVESPFQGA